MDIDEEREEALHQDAMTQEAYNRMALNQYASVYGAESPESAWILSPYDTWEPNPHYRGPKVKHPEEDDYD